MPKFVKRLTFSLLVGLVLFFSLAPYSQALAQTNSAQVSGNSQSNSSSGTGAVGGSGGTWYDQGYFEWFNKVYDQNNSSEIFGERYTAAQVQWVFYSLVSLLVVNKPFFQCVESGDISSCTNLISPISATSPSNNNKQSLTSLIFSSDRPLSFISYTKNLSQKLSLVNEVHAQTPGFGFSALNVIQDLWSSVRNIVYGLFVLLSIILAFMVMFRVKINPQTVITVQSAIPKLIIALVLVTFSYAIAGLMVDLMYIVIGLLSLILASTGKLFASDPVTLFKFLTTGYVGLNSTLGIPLGIFGLFILYAFIFPGVLASALFAQNGGVSAAISSILTLGAIPILIQLISIVAFVIVLIILVVNFFKIIWMLLKTFAQILLTVVFGPFQIALGVVIPGMGFGSWLKSLAANLAVFPTTGLLMALAFVFLNLAGSAAADAFKTIKLWDFLGILNPGLSGAGNTLSFNGWPPLLNGPRGVLSLIYLGTSLVLLTLIPKTVEIIQGFITGRPFAYGTAIGEAFGPIRGAWNQTGGVLVQGVQRERGEAFARKYIPIITETISNILPKKEKKQENPV